MDERLWTYRGETILDGGRSAFRYDNSTFDTEQHAGPRGSLGEFRVSTQHTTHPAERVTWTATSGVSSTNNGFGTTYIYTNNSIANVLPKYRIHPTGSERLGDPIAVEIEVTPVVDSWPPENSSEVNAHIEANRIELFIVSGDCLPTVGGNEAGIEGTCESVVVDLVEEDGPVVTHLPARIGDDITWDAVSTVSALGGGRVTGGMSVSFGTTILPNLGLSLGYREDQHRLEYNYQVEFEPLERSIPLDLYRISDSAFEALQSDPDRRVRPDDLIGGRIFRTNSQTAIGSYDGFIDLDLVGLSGASGNFVLVADLANSNAEMIETDNYGTVSFGPTASIDSLQWVQTGRGGIEIEFTAPEDFDTDTIEFYWSDDEVRDEFDRSATVSPIDLVQPGQGVIHGIDFAPPRATGINPRTFESFLIARLPGENGSSDVEKTLKLQIEKLDVQLDVPDTLLRKERYSANLNIEYVGPVPIDVYVNWDADVGWYSENEPGTDSDLRQETITLVETGDLPWNVTLAAQPTKDGESVSDIYHNWDWIPDPATYLDQNEQFKDARNDDVLGFAAGLVDRFFGTTLGAINTVRTLYRDTLQGAALIAFRHEEVTVSHDALIDPVIDGGALANLGLAHEFTVSKEVSATVHPEKEFLLDKYNAHAFGISIGLSALQNANDLLGTVLPLNLLQFTLMTDHREDLYRAAFDPPAPDFQTFNQPQASAADAADSAETSPYRRLTEQILLLGETQSSYIKAIDRSDRAVRENDHFWHAEQLVLAADQAQSTAFLEAERAILHTLLQPLRREIIGNPAESIADVAANGFDAAVVDGLRESGFSDEQIQILQDTYAQMDPAQIAVDQQLRVERIQPFFSAETSINLLRSAIQLRIDELNLPQRELTAAEHAALQSQLDEVNAIASKRWFSHADFQAVDNFVRTARNFVLETNNPDIIEQYLEPGYLALLNVSMSASGFEGLHTLGDELLSQGAISNTTYNEVMSRANEIETYIAQADWQATEIAFNLLRDYVNNLTPPHGSSAARAELKPVVDTLYDQLLNDPQLPQLEFPADPVVIGDQFQTRVRWLDGIEIPADVFAAMNGSVVTVSADATLQPASTIHVRPTGNYKFVDSEIVFDELPVARITQVSATSIQIEPYSTATVDILQDVLSQVEYATPRGTQLGNSHGVTVNLQDNRGGETEITSSIDFQRGTISLDIDGDNSAAALTDGILTIRYLAGFTGSSLASGAVNTGGSRTDADSVEYFLDASINEFLDVDGDGQRNALTDGILILRYLAGFRGQALINNAVNPGGVRSNATSIATFLEAFLPPASGQASGGGAATSAAQESETILSQGQPRRDSSFIDDDWWTTQFGSALDEL